jgi:predicted transcriptional regulator
MKPMTTQVAKTVIELYQNGVAVRVIADLTGHTMSAVNNVINANRDVCPRRYASKPTEEQYAMLKEMWAAGATKRAMADKLGCKLGTIKNIIDRHREDFPSHAKKFEVTAEELDLMRRMWADGEKVARIAEHVKWSYPAVHSYIQRHREDFPRRRCKSVETACQGH